MRTITRNLLEKLITDYDDNADVSIGGPYDTHIITPILERLDPDPLETDFPFFARQILRDYYPDLQFEEGDALNTAVAKPMELLMRPILDQLSVLLRNQSLKNYQSMDSDEIDDLLANFFWHRPSGGYASGAIKIYFANPTTVQVSSGNVSTTSSGLRFVPTLPYSITADSMLSNKEGNLYYMEAYITAESPGSEYNIEKDSMVSISGLPSVVKVKNPRKFSGGVDTYTDSESVDAAKLAITERTLTSNNGIITLLTSTLPGIRHAYTVGFHDDEMKRDIIKGGSAGEVEAWGRDAYLVEDGDYDDSTQYIGFYATDVTSYIGPIGEISEEFVISINGEDYVVSEVVASNQIKVTSEMDYPPSRGNLVNSTDLGTTANSNVVDSTATNFVTSFVEPGHAINITTGSDIGWYKIVEVNQGGTPQNISLDEEMSATSPNIISFYIPYGIDWVLRKKELSLSSIPYGFVDSEDEIASEVHIGGMADIHLAGELEERTMNLSALSDQEPYFEDDFGYATVNSISYSGSLPDGHGIEVGDQVEILEGDGAGTYRIIDVVDPNVFVTPNTGVTSGTSKCKFTRSIDIELSDPVYSKYEGTDLSTTISSQLVTTSSSVGFTSKGVVVGDYLRIPNGDDSGDWEIIAISGTAGTILKVSHYFTRSYASLDFEIVSKQDPINLPVVDVESVELLDTNDEATGELIPYQKPLDVRAVGPFTNIGHGEYTEFTGLYTGIRGVVDISGGVVSGGASLNASVNGGSTITINFPAGAYTPLQVAGIINNDIPDVASIYTDAAAAQYLVISSSNRLITIDALGTANHLFGVAGATADNSDQLVISGTTWEDEGVTDRMVIRLDSDPNSFYRIYNISGTKLRAYKLFSDARFWASEPSVTATVGERSLGIARCYFKDPTFFLVAGPMDVGDIGTYTGDDLPWDRDITKLEAELSTGASVKFTPDSSLDDPLIPSGDTQPNNGYCSVGTDELESVITGGTTIDNRSSRIDFLSWGAQVGDILELTVVPLIGTVDLVAAFPGPLTGDTLEFTLDGHDYVIEFDSNDTGIDAVISTINKEVDQTIAYKHVSGVSQYLILETDLDLNLTADSATLMGLAMPVDNEHPDEGNYRVDDLNVSGSVYTITVTEMDGTATTFTADTYNSHFKVKRTGMQRFDPADMIEGDDGIYYVDIELMSEGFGDFFNVDEKQLFTITDYESYGWYLSTENEATSYSEYEKLWMHISPYFLPQDEDYDPDSIYMMSGQNVQITYNKSYLVEEAQTYVESDEIRNVCLNPLVRHLLPVFVYFDIDYAGGSDTDVMEDTLEELIEAIMPDVPLSVYDISNTISGRGAVTLTNPVELAAIVWEDDRSVRIERSENEINPGRRYVMYVGSMELSRT